MSLKTVKKLNTLHSIYHQPARLGNFSVENGILYIKENFEHDTKYINLCIVPSSVCSVVFVAFHDNPIVAHYACWRTFHCIWELFFWPGMYQYCKRMVKACPGCALSNCTTRISEALVNSFPMDAPIRILFVDVYAAGTDLNFEGNSHYLIAVVRHDKLCRWGTFPRTYPVYMASSLMKIWMRFGFSHTIVVDKASVYLNIFAETTDFLGINIHVLSGENHDPMIVERINRFFNSCLTTFCNERGTTKVAQERILMSLYAWNSAPMVGTDISRSMVVVGRKFKFSH